MLFFPTFLPIVSTHEPIKVTTSSGTNSTSARKFVVYTSKGTIAGKVTKLGDASALDGVLVEVFNGGILPKSAVKYVKRKNVVPANWKAAGSPLAQATTGANGLYSIPSLAYGTYDVRASKDAYVVSITTGIAVIAGQTTRLDLSLKLGDIPRITAWSPVKNAVNVSVDSKIKITFSCKLDTATIIGDNIGLSANGKALKGKLTYSAEENRIIFAPERKFKTSVVYSMLISKKIKSADGFEMNAEDAWQFTTQATAIPIDPGIRLNKNKFNPDKGENLNVGCKVKTSGKVKITVYNIAGKVVKTLLVSENALAGQALVAVWDGTADDGRKVKAGVFLLHIEGGGVSQTKKVVVLK